MIELVAIEQGGTNKTVLDVSDKPIELNVQFWDINNPMSSHSPHSYNFTLPYTRTNDTFFSYYYNCNTAEGTFSASTETEIELYVDGLLVMQGVLQLHSCSVDRGYEVNVLEKIAKVFDKIKGLTWSQLFTDDSGAVDTDLDHALNWTNVKNSWVTTNDITTGNVGAGTIVYPLSDWGQGLSNNSQQAGTGTGFTFQFYQQGGSILSGGMNSTTVNVLNLKPAIRIKYLIDYIFESVGYTVQSDFFATADFQKIYMFLATNTLRATGRATYGFLAGISSGFQLAAGQASTWYNVLFLDESAPGYDPDGLVTGGVFTAPYDGVFTIRTQFVVRTSAGNVLQGYQFYTRLTINTNTTVPDQFTWCVNQQWTLCEHEFVLTLGAGDTVTAYVSHTSTSNAVTVADSNPAGTTYMTLDELSTTNEFVDVSQNMPEVTVDKWFKAIVERFNLVMYSTPQEPTIIRIEPWRNWWNDSTTNRDWTEVVDQGSIKIEPTTKYQKKKYTFSDAEGKDFPNRWWQENFGWVKGRYEYNNLNDFVSGETKVEAVFQPLRLRPIYKTIQNTGTSQIPNVLVPCFWDWHDGSDGSVYLKEFRPAKPVLAYYNGLQDIGNGGKFFWDGTQYTTYPYFAEYNEVGVDTDTLSLAWGYDWPDNFNAPFVSGGTTGGTTQRYAFYQYWSQMFNEVYGIESRIMTCKIKLDYIDLVNLRFNDSIYLDGCFWRVMKITNYALNSEALATAQLVKLLNKPVGRESDKCNARVDSFNTDGTVNFVDSSGNPVSATEECCTLNGYVWDSRSSKCFARSRGGGGGYGGGGNNGGGIGHDGVKANRNIDNNIPNAYSGDFSRSLIEPYAQRGSIGNNIKTHLYATTSGTTGTKARQDNGIQEFTVPLDSIIYVRITAVATEIGGSAATLGNTSTQFVQGSVANTRTSATNKSVSRTVGTTTTIAENKDSGTTPQISINQVQSADGDTALFNVTCTGRANINFQWFLTVEMTTTQISGSTDTLARNVVFNLDPAESEQTNTSGGDFLYYNLTLA